MNTNHNVTQAAVGLKAVGNKLYTLFTGHFSDLGLGRGLLEQALVEALSVSTPHFHRPKARSSGGLDFFCKDQYPSTVGRQQEL